MYVHGNLYWWSSVAFLSENGYLYNSGNIYDSTLDHSGKYYAHTDIVMKEIPPISR